jgi:hypothetical protein
VAEPAQRRTDSDGGKYYEHPSRTEDHPGDGGSVVVRPARYDSVTTALGIRDKDALKYWSANLAAKRAVENLPKLMASVLVPDCGRSAARTEPYGCGDCLPCVQRWVALFHVGETARRAREGTAAHDVLESWILTGDWTYRPVMSGDPAVDQYVPTQDVMAPYIQALQAFVAEYGLTRDDFLVAECTVWNHRLRYAGTLDFIVRIEPRTKKAAELCVRVNASNTRNVHLVPGASAPTPAELLAPVVILGDCKSRENEKAALYSDNTLQLTAYRNAETMTPKRAAPEMERPMIETDAAAVLQVRPDGYTFRPVVSDGKAMRAFEAVLVDYRWESQHGDESILVRAFPLPDGWEKPTWERATTPTGGLCGCAGCDDPTDGRCLFGGARPLGLHTREVDRDGTPVTAPAKKAAPRKRAAKKAAPPASPTAAPGPSATVGAGLAAPARSSPTLDSMRQRFRGGDGQITDDMIPF